MVLRAMLALVVPIGCEHPAPVVASPEDDAAEWSGRWRVTWERPEPWRPTTFNGSLTFELDSDRWSARLSFAESSMESMPRVVDVREDSARLVFTGNEGDVLRMDLFRDGQEVHGMADVASADGRAIPWSPVRGHFVADGTGPRVADGFTFPWPVASPADVGLDEKAVRQLVADASDADFSGFVLVRDGRLIVATGYDLERRVNIASVSKALSSLAVPYLLQEQLWPSLDASIAPALGWTPDDRRAAITLRHVLSHTTGLETPDYRSWIQAAAADHRADLQAAKLLRAPGTAFEYSNRTFELTSEVVAYASGVPLDEFLRPRLLEPLEVGAIWYHDPKGHARVHAGVGANALDLAKVGALLVDDGAWNGRRVLPAGWVATATTPVMQTDAREVGLGWFLLPEGQGFQHTGDSGAFLMVLPEKRIAAAGVHVEPGGIGTVMRGVQGL